MLQLIEEIGHGEERIVYKHPDCLDKVVKVRKLGASGNRNLIDARYWLLLTSKQRSCLPRFFGWDQTQFGPGAVYEAVRDADGALSRPLNDLVLSGTLTKKQADALVHDLADRLFAAGLLTWDTAPCNLLYRRSGAGEELVVIDGFGPHWWKWKDPLRARFPVLARRKLVRSRKRILLCWTQWCENNAIAA